ncbi:CHAP domain-containing protein [Siculibacillus lacustris]|uniref:CHAP domain-containing protein n=1 Tax=Siculibacillus lacustris TaxID=1549641 RepID=A0A4Q9VFL7_9HYPH|nr:CHAP domain-containing protein [Siculibacillus lacustris]TBW33718.1 CHAP domain-containing protein [Siculibacillus lacustris]
MITPLQFMLRYRNIVVNIEAQDNLKRVTSVIPVTVSLNKYFMMNWAAGSSQATEFAAVTAGSPKDAWFRQYKERIRTAAMGKGSPEDYGLALQWALYENHIQNPSQTTVQSYFDQNMGIDCSGFVTNYLIARGKKPDSQSVQRDTSAASYFSAAKAVNDPLHVRQGDLLVFMKGNSVLTGPGHVAVVESYVPQSRSC